MERMPAASGNIGPTHTFLSGWGGTPRSAADVFAPASESQTKDLVPSLAGPTLARGLGRSYGDASLVAGGSAIDMTGVSAIRDLDLVEGTITAAAGVTLDALIRWLLPVGYFLPVVPGTRFVTLGGAIAADIHGKNHHADGSIQRHVVSFDLLLASGEVLTVTRESHPSVFAATMGGLGLTGIVLAATLRLLPVESAYLRVDRERVPNLERLMERCIESDDQYRYSVAWVDCLAGGSSLGRGVLMRANHALRDELPAAKQKNALVPREGLNVTWPAWLPGGVLRRSSVTAFNEAAYYGSSVLARHGFENVMSYFFPLDRIHHWNRMYGGRGFVQYQFVVPDGEEKTMAAALARLSRLRVPSFLAVLKRMGPGEGMLSFPAPGWTLALDIPANVGGLADLLDEIDRLVVEAGGRIYLAKDSRTKASLISKMYPELERWRSVRRQLDPEGRMQSDLGRRLKLAQGEEE